MSDQTSSRPQHEPATRDLPAAPEEVRDVTDDEAEQTKGGLGFPDVCKTPSPAGPIPIPYPNFSK